MAIASNLGYPRIGLNRELKKALENYWEGKIPLEELQQTGKNIREHNWILQKEIGIQEIPSNDFSFYDHVLDTAVMLGAIPERFQSFSQVNPIDCYFAMARGAAAGKYQDIPVMEMTKWFNTNYHYIVPEISPDTRFRLDPSKPIDEFLEAKIKGIITRPVILGPLSFLLLSKSSVESFSVLERLFDLLPLYQDLFHRLHSIGAKWVQVDEPFLVLDLNEQLKSLYHKAYEFLGFINQRPKILLASYFASLGDNLDLTFSLPLEGIHVDLVNGFDLFPSLLSRINTEQYLSLGMVDGHNIWKNDLEKSFNIISAVEKKIGSNRMMLSPSCSLMHVPQDLSLEDSIPLEIKNWLSFAKQKLFEVVFLTQSVNHGKKSVLKKFEENQEIIKRRSKSPLVNNLKGNQRLKKISQNFLKRNTSFKIRQKIQQNKLNLPNLPTTTIGSFPQTKEIRNVRDQFTKGIISKIEYEKFMKREISRVIQFQEEVGLDVLVHGEFERNDMVQFFAEQMSGFAFTDHGWVQSFGSRYVRPPIIYGDVSRPKPVTVKWIRYAQSLTKRPVKGMVTGPITILNWSFVRDDQPRSCTCQQISLAIRDEVLDLEKAGIQIIQVDEPAMREGLPLHRKEWEGYLKWAVMSFQIAVSGVRDDTQIHTHMCYSEFDDIIEAIISLNADVISIEAARSQMDLLNTFSHIHFPYGLGPGVYDIHSPRVPSAEEIYKLIQKALKVIPADQLWVNPDCGLKTRKWNEIDPALRNLVAATKKVRKELKLINNCEAKCLKNE